MRHSIFLKVIQRSSHQFKINYFIAFMLDQDFFSKQCFFINKHNYDNYENKILCKYKYINLKKLKNKIKFEFRNKRIKMSTYLISKDLDNLLFLDVINEDFQEQSKLISILISSLIQQSPLLNIYKEKKKLLLDTLNSQRVNEKNLFREKLVSLFNFLLFLDFYE